MTAPVSDLDVAAFHRVRPRLFGIAYRILGNATEADDVVQETWLRWQRADRSEVRDATAFLATTATRLAINVIQSARARHETALAGPQTDTGDADADPAVDVEQRDALARALRIVLAKLSPTERAAYVLREGFDYPYRQVAELLSLSEPNARQLVLRARRRLAGANGRPVAVAEQRRFVDTYVAASRTGALVPLEELLTAA